MVYFENSNNVTAPVVNTSLTDTIPAGRAVVLVAESSLSAAEAAAAALDRHGAKLAGVTLSGANGLVYGVTLQAIPPGATSKVVTRGRVRITAAGPGSNPNEGQVIASDAEGRATNASGLANEFVFGKAVTAPADETARYGAQGATDFGSPETVVYADIDCSATSQFIDVAIP